ncbi:tubby-like protein 4 [Rutidosis leptorrhynchoides]|uniref:tubby-like protein 4 n=1 Tax=Rutidosis leptorrhynchoides TaxID=125765 RepID=UPI003A994FB1
MPTVVTCTGSHRSMKVYIPKHQSMRFNNAKVQLIGGLPDDWEGKMDKIYKLCSRTPNYNNLSKQYELDFRDRGRLGLRIQRSVKNFQLTYEENGRQTILQLGKVDKSKYIMDFRYPLAGYQALCIAFHLSVVQPLNTLVSTENCNFLGIPAQWSSIGGRFCYRVIRQRALGWDSKILLLKFELCTLNFPIGM